MNKNNPYLQDILQQPQAVQDTLDGLQNLTSFVPFARYLVDGRIQNIILTGMGSSFHALHPLNLRLVHSGHSPVMIETSELVHHLPGLLSRPKTLVIAVSQSGRSAEIVRLLDGLAPHVQVLGVTNTPGSPLAGRAAFALITRAGAETTVSCKTYLAALAALELLGAVLTGGSFSSTRNLLLSVPLAVDRYLSRWEEFTGQIMAGFSGVEHLILIGRGVSMAAVGTGGLIVKEAAHFPSEGMSSAAFRHGPFELVGPRLFVLAYAGLPPTVDLNTQLAADILSAGGKAALVAPQSSPAMPWDLPDLSPIALPLVEILPAQMLSLALAWRKSHEPGQFSFSSKVTTTE